MKPVKFLLTIIILLTINNVILAQDPLGGRDLSQVKVDALTETQITQIKRKLDQWSYQTVLTSVGLPRSDYQSMPLLLLYLNLDHLMDPEQKLPFEKSLKA